MPWKWLPGDNKAEERRMPLEPGRLAVEETRILAAKRVLLGESFPDNHWASGQPAAKNANVPPAKTLETFKEENMKKLAVALGLLVLVAIAVPAAAQGPFADVPTDHWAYNAVNELQQKGLLLGYPDGTFSGKRAVTRYEFAVAISRALPLIVQEVLRQVPGGPGGPSQADFEALRRRVEELERRPGGPGPQPPQQVTKADLDKLQRLMDQFRDELAALGVDVDALKRDLAALTERVSALEKEVERVKLGGTWDTFAIATNLDEGTPVDRDNRVFSTSPSQDELSETIGAVYDADLNIRGKVGEATAANATINFGNYLNYIGFVDDYIGGIRATSLGSGLTSAFFPYFLNIEAGFGAGSLQVGRIPLQLTPYTLKLIDVDTYTDVAKTDTGDYPVDGAKLSWQLGRVGLTAFAAKNNQNEHLKNGLTSQPTGGLYGAAPFSEAGGHAAGGLTSVDQSAGVRVTVATPWKGNLGLNWLRVAGQDAAKKYDQADVFGGDINLKYGRYNIGFEYAQTNTLAAEGSPAPDVDDLNKALDGSVAFNIGGVGLKVGARSVERNFTAPGYWEKIGRWTNPANIQGPYLNVDYGLRSNLKLAVGGAFYKGVNNLGSAVPAAINEEDDELWRATAGLKWGLSTNWAIDVGAEFVRWSPNEGGDTDETYWTVGAAWNLNPSARLRLAYQIIDYSPEGTAAPYGSTKYSGQIAVAEFGVKF